MKNIKTIAKRIDHLLEQENYPAAFKLANETWADIESKNINTLESAIILRAIAFEHFLNDRINKSIIFHQKVLAIYEQDCDKHIVEYSLSLNHIAECYLKIKDLAKALDYFNKARKLVESSIRKGNSEVDLFKGASSLSNKISNIYNQLDDVDQAEKYLKKSISYAKKTNDFESIFKTKMCLISFYIMIGKIDSAELKAFELEREARREQTKAIVNSLGRDNRDEIAELKEALIIAINCHAKILLIQGKVQFAIMHFFNALSELEQLEDGHPIIVEILFSIGQSYMLIDDFVEAEKLLKMALHAAKQIDKDLHGIEISNIETKLNLIQKNMKIDTAQTSKNAALKIFTKEAQKDRVAKIAKISKKSGK